MTPGRRRHRLDRGRVAQACSHDPLFRLRRDWRHIYSRSAPHGRWHMSWSPAATCASMRSTGTCRACARAALDIVALLTLAILALAMLDCGWRPRWSNNFDGTAPTRRCARPFRCRSCRGCSGSSFFAASIAAALRAALAPSRAATTTVPTVAGRRLAGRGDRERARQPGHRQARTPRLGAESREK